MPINYKEYHPKWKLISKLVRYRRAQNKCEQCGILNQSVVKRLSDGSFRVPSQAEWDMIHSSIKHGGHNMTSSLKKHKFTKIVLTVAHLDGDKSNNRFENLKALCQKCHLAHDLTQHVRNRKYGRNHRKINYQIEFGNE